MLIDGRCLVIAEVAQSHDGSLGMAHAFIDAAANSGAGAIKFQTHFASEESTPAEPWRVRFSSQDATRYDYWRRMEFSDEQWIELKKHADDCGLLFLSSPFSRRAVELLERIGVPAWKVASGEIANYPLLDSMLATGKPMLLSTGMSPWQEIDAAVDRVRAAGRPVAVMQCTTEYPCPPEKAGLNLLAEMRSRYACPVGFSDHSGRIYAGLAAASLGASIVEVHVAFSRQMFGPDVPSSVTFEELRQLAEGIAFIERALANPVDKDRVANDKQELRSIFGRSMVAASDLPAGTVLDEAHVAFKKPGTGLGLSRRDEVLGRRLRRAIPRDQQLRLDDLE